MHMYNKTPGTKEAVVFEAKILSVDLNGYSEMKTIKYSLRKQKILLTHPCQSNVTLLLVRIAKKLISKRKIL